MPRYGLRGDAVYIALELMNYECPLCSSDLKGLKLRKVPKPGESSFLMLRWHLECQKCAGELMQNQHPSEQQVLPKLFLVVAVLNGLGWLSGYKASGTVVLAVLVSMFVAPYLILHFTIPKDWKRYVTWKEAPF